MSERFPLPSFTQSPELILNLAFGMQGTTTACCQDSANQTPLQVAARRGWLEVCCCLAHHVLNPGDDRDGIRNTCAMCIESIILSQFLLLLKSAVSLFFQLTRCPYGGWRCKQNPTLLSINFSAKQHDCRVLAVWRFGTWMIPQLR